MKTKQTAGEDGCGFTNWLSLKCWFFGRVVKVPTIPRSWGWPLLQMTGDKILLALNLDKITLYCLHPFIAQLYSKV